MVQRIETGAAQSNFDIIGVSNYKLYHRISQMFNLSVLPVVANHCHTR